MKDAEVRRAADILRAGGLVVFPTETVYGLGCDAANPRAVARVFDAKGRPSFNPLIAHVRDLEQARLQGAFPEPATLLAAALWPGPLTIVVRRAPGSTVSELACAGLSTIALRVPVHPIAQALLEAFGGPIAAPSANRSGHVSATTADHARVDLEGKVDMVLDAGPCRLGLESTIVSFDDAGHPSLLRPGAIPRAAIENLIGPIASPTPDRVTAPGMLQSHYAPRARLRLDATSAEEGEAYLAFNTPAPPNGLTLSESGDLVEAAANLYAHLRTLDAGGARVIAVAPIPAHGLGEAIRDRLARAAAPRP